MRQNTNHERSWKCVEENLYVAIKEERDIWRQWKRQLLNSVWRWALRNKAQAQKIQRSVWKEKPGSWWGRRCLTLLCNIYILAFYQSLSTPPLEGNSSMASLRDCSWLLGLEESYFHMLRMREKTIPPLSLISLVSKLGCVSKEGIYVFVSMLFCFYLPTLFKIHVLETWKENLPVQGDS